MQDNDIAPRGSKRNRSNVKEGGYAANSFPHSPDDTERLTRGGLEIYRRTMRSVSTCNRLAEISGIGGTNEVAI